MQKSKQILRSELLQKRDLLSIYDRIKFSQTIVSTLFERDVFKFKTVLHCYCSFASEVITSELIQKVLSLNFKVVVPIANSAKRELTHSVVTAETTFTAGKYGIQEPTAISKISKQQLNNEGVLIVIPLVGFDSNCNRLGYGGGYYDRFLQYVPNARKIGIAFSLQETEAIPTELTDIPLDEIITEQQVFLHSTVE